MENICTSYLVIFIVIFKRILSLIQIIAPILGIVSLSFTIIKMVKNPEEKKLTKKVINSFIALILLFFIPLFVTILVNLATENSSFASCLENNKNNSFSIANSYSENDNDSKKHSILINPKGYEKGQSSSSLPKKATILFVGNSFSKRGITDGIVDIGNNIGFSINYKFADKPGSKLNDIYNHGNNKSLIQNNTYDAVILQPDYIDQDSSGNNKTGALKTIKDVKSKNPNAIIYYRKIWDYKSTSKSKVQQLQNLYTNLMQELENELNITIIPIEDGISMHEAVWNYNINVFDSDNYHQNSTGVYLIDYCISSVIFGIDPTTIGDFKIANYSQLDSTTSKALKSIAKKNCYHS